MIVVGPPGGGPPYAGSCARGSFLPGAGIFRLTGKYVKLVLIFAITLFGATVCSSKDSNLCETYDLLGVATCDKNNDNTLLILGLLAITGTGITTNVSNLVPQYILDEMKALGMPIYTGTNPPAIPTATYLLNPTILYNSNIATDTIGAQFSDQNVRFYNYSSSALTISVDVIETSSSTTGIGAFIIGNNNSFSVFAESTLTKNGYTAKVIRAFSGTVSSGGITNFYTSIFMKDDGGDPGNVFISNGQGRVAYDSDGFSPKL